MRGTGAVVHALASALRGMLLDTKRGVLRRRVLSDSDEEPGARVDRPAVVVRQEPPKPTEGSWLGNSLVWPAGDTTFALTFDVNAPDVARFTLAYAVDNRRTSATLNGTPLVGVPGSGHDTFKFAHGYARQILAPAGEGLFVQWENKLSVTVHNSSTGPMGIYMWGSLIDEGMRFDDPRRFCHRTEVLPTTGGSRKAEGVCYSCPDGKIAGCNSEVTKKGVGPANSKACKTNDYIYCFRRA